MTSIQNAPQNIDLKSFGLVVAVLLASSAGAGAALVDSAISGPVTALLIGVPLAAVGWFRPRVLAPAYRAWSGLGRLVGRVTRYYVLSLLFAVLWLVGRAGGRIQLSPTFDGQSGWIPKNAEGPAYESQACRSITAGRGRSWRSMLLRWSGLSGNLWLVALLPLLLLLAASDPRGRKSMGGTTYTLY